MRDSSTAPAPTVSIANGSVLTRALYVRDRFALPSALDVPELDPKVTSLPGGDVPVDAWDQWWQTLLERDANSSMPTPANPHLAELADVADEDARRWEDEHVTWDPLYDARWVSTWLIDHRLTTSVEVLVVGAGGVWHSQVSPARHLVSIGFYRAHDQMDALLRQALEAQDA